MGAEAGKRRQAAISKAISEALRTHGPDDQDGAGRLEKLLKSLSTLLALFRLDLRRFRYADFLTLRHDFWHLDESEYTGAFQGDSEQQQQQQQHGEALTAAGDLGYSGSTFFHTKGGEYVVKSLDRRFESHFFMDELFAPYAAHMKTHPGSLLVRITDMLFAPRTSLGSLLNIQPRYYMVMENILHTGDERRWETYDLKPEDYFFPERDIADGRLAPQHVKDKLVDTFDDKIDVSASWKQELKDVLAQDTTLLADNNAIDYSLFLCRLPLPPQEANETDHTESISIISGQNQPSWRAGIVSNDGKWVYRAVVLDFLWARHKFQAKAMSGLIGAFNLLFDKGPMTITTEPMEYRRRFLAMVDQLLS